MFGQEVHTNNIMSTIPLEGRHCNRQGGQDWHFVRGDARLRMKQNALVFHKGTFVLLPCQAPGHA
jgi:hypothetical protein